MLTKRRIKKRKTRSGKTIGGSDEYAKLLNSLRTQGISKITQHLETIKDEKIMTVVAPQLEIMKEILSKAIEKYTELSKDKISLITTFRTLGKQRVSNDFKTKKDELKIVLLDALQTVVKNTRKNFVQKSEEHRKSIEIQLKHEELELEKLIQKITPNNQKPYDMDIQEKYRRIANLQSLLRQQQQEELKKEQILQFIEKEIIEPLDKNYRENYRTDVDYTLRPASVKKDPEPTSSIPASVKKDHEPTSSTPASVEHTVNTSETEIIKKLFDDFISIIKIPLTSKLSYDVRMELNKFILKNGQEIIKISSFASKISKQLSGGTTENIWKNLRNKLNLVTQQIDAGSKTIFNDFIKPQFEQQQPDKFRDRITKMIVSKDFIGDMERLFTLIKKMFNLEESQKDDFFIFLYYYTILKCCIFKLCILQFYDFYSEKTYMYGVVFTKTFKSDPTKLIECIDCLLTYLLEEKVTQYAGVVINEKVREYVNFFINLNGPKDANKKFVIEYETPQQFLDEGVFSSQTHGGKQRRIKTRHRKKQCIYGRRTTRKQNSSYGTR